MTWREDLARWPADRREEWAERAAIREYCGGQRREEAEAEAYWDVWRRKETKRVGVPVQRR